MGNSTRSAVDGLTDRERRVVKARLEYPTATLEEIGKLASIEGKPNKLRSVVSYVLKRAPVKVALRHPPPTLAKTKINRLVKRGVEPSRDEPEADEPKVERAGAKARDLPPEPERHALPEVDLKDAASMRAYLLQWYVRIVEDRNTPQSERIRALTQISEMTPGGKVPVGVHHTGTWTLERFVEAAGGKPADVPDRLETH